MQKGNNAHEVKSRNRKLCCDCRDDTFYGLPCRHIMTVVTKDRTVDAESLRIQVRWGTNFCQEQDQNKESDELPFYKEVNQVENQNAIEPEERVSLFFNTDIKSSLA